MDPAFTAWLSQRTLQTWRAADGVLRRSEGAIRDAHERAVAIALQYLAAFQTIEDLVVHHTCHRYRRGDDLGDPPDGTVEAWVAEACRVAEGADPLDAAVVEGAALWRRTCDLLAAAPGGQQPV